MITRTHVSPRPGLARALALALALALLALGAPAVDAQTIMRSHTSASGPAFNSIPLVADAGDLDGDGVHDLSVTLLSVQMPEGFGPVMSFLSGADGSLLQVHTPGVGDDYYEYGILTAGLGDLDGDGVSDLAVSRHTGGATLVTHPTLEVISGADPSVVLFSYDVAQGPYQGIRAVLGPGDLDGDGVPDLVFSFTGCIAAPGQKPAGRVQAHSGADGSLLFGHCGDAPGDRLGDALACAGDVNGDGVEDIAVGAPQSENYTQGEFGYARVLSGVDGAVLLEVEDDTVPPVPYDPGFASGIAGVGDVDGDGLDDLAVGVPQARVDGLFLGALRVFSGADGALLLERNGPPTVSGFSSSLYGKALVSPGDLDGDGVREVGVVTNDVGDGTAGIFFVSADDGAPLFTQPATQDSFWAWIGVATPGDLNGDGTPDYVLSGGLPEGQVSQSVGVVQVHSGRRLLFPDLGQGLAGGAGVPLLVGEGSLERELPLDVTLTNGAPDANAWLVVGLSELGAPFKGGTLVPAPDLIVEGLVSDAAGGVALHTALPLDVPVDFELLLQAWVLDAAAPHGLAASNALLASKQAVHAAP